MRGLEQIPWLYDGLCAVMERTGLAPWRRWLAAGARGRTLDVGCGTGRGLPLYGAGVRAIGLDPARDSLARARRRAPGVPLVQGRAEALPFRDGVFDTVVSSLVFCSVPEPARGLAEVRRVLRSDGRLRMLEHVRSRRAWKAAFQDRVQPLWTRLSGGCHPNRETERAVEAAGFVIESDGRDARADLRRFSARTRESRKDGSTIIRPYRPSDFDPVNDVWRRARLEALADFQARKGHTAEEDRAYFRRVILVENEVWVAEVDGRAVGLIARAGDLIDQLYVAPEHQRQGVGQALLAHAKRLSPSGLRLHTFRSNDAARAFYERAGFVPVTFGISPAPESEPDVEYRWSP